MAQPPLGLILLELMKSLPPSSTNEKSDEDSDSEPEIFRYRNSLDREYDTKTKNITSIKFHTVRYPDDDNLNEVIYFNPATTEAEAIRAAEDFLNEPVTDEYYQLRAHDLADGCTYNYRYEMLANSFFMEFLEVNDGQITMIFGS